MELLQQCQKIQEDPQQPKEQQQQLLYNPTDTYHLKQLQLSTQKVYKHQAISQKVLTTLFLITLVLLLLRGAMKDSQQIQPLAPSAKPATIKSQRLPRIFWIYTENQKEAEPMEDDIYLNYYAERAKRAGYQVRYANSWNSYDWLTPQTIALVSKTMQNSKIDQTVHSILKLALLLENGGLMVGWGNMFLSTDFAWLEQMFDQYQGDPMVNYICRPKQSFLFMLQKPHPTFGTLFCQGLIAAVPNSSILRQAFNVLAQVITTGVFPFEDEVNALQWNQDTSVSFISQSLAKVVSVVVYKHRKVSEEGQANSLCQLGIQSTQQPVAFQYPREDEFHLVHTLTSPCGWQRYLTYKQKIDQKNKIYFLSRINQPALKSYLGSLIMQTVLPEDLSAESLLYQILSAQGNREVFLEPFPDKDIQLCLVLMEPLDQIQLQQTVSAFHKQTFKKWKIIVPTNNIHDSRQGKDQKVLLIPNKSNKVHNIEKSVAKFCQPKGYAVLLNQGEYFNSQKALQQIAKAVQPRHVVGLYLSLSVQGCPMHPKKRYTNFDREQNGIINPRIDIMKHFLNHFRVISVQTFRLLPQFSMRDMYGKYFEDRTIFLMDLLDQVKEALTQPNQIFVIKKYWNLWEVPQRIELLTSSIVLQIKKLEEVNLNQLRLTRTRINSAGVGQQLRSTLAWKIPFTKLIARNPGDDFVSVDDRTGPNVIPKIIHQVWLGTRDLPPAKKYFYDKTRRMYPEYEIKLWREQNITREAFPLTYDVIKTLIAFNKKSPYNKLASVTDIMRHQILYHEGGFWKDAGMNLLRPILDKFLKFKLVLPVDRIFKYRYLQGMCFFGNVPKYENLIRITGYRNINRMRIYRVNPLLVAGPVDFRQLLQGQEEYDPDILLLPYETFYPGQVGQHPQNDLCTKRKKNIRHDQKYEIKQNGWYLMSNCEDLYPWAFGIEHNHYGSTWQKRTPK